MIPVLFLIGLVGITIFALVITGLAMIVEWVSQ